MLGILFCTFYILLFTYIIFKAPLFRLQGLNNIYPLVAFYLKLICGVALWYIYAYHYKNRYTSDIFKYYDDGKLMYSTVHNNFTEFLKMLTGIGDSGSEISGYYHQMKSWINDHDSNLYNNSHFIIRLNALFMFLSGGHYAVHVIFMCFIALAGFSFLYKFFYPYLTSKPKGLFAALFLFPSVLLWTSGILKECLVIFGLGLVLYYFNNLKDKKGSTFLNILLVLAGVILLFEAKAYVLLCIIPCLMSEVFISKIIFAQKHPWLTYFFVTGIYIGAGLSIDYVAPRYNALQMLADKQRDMTRMVRGGIYLAQGRDSDNFARIDAPDSGKIIAANTYSDSLMHHGGLPYITSSEFCYHEEATGHIALFKLKAGMPYELIQISKGDTLHLTATDTALYRIDVYAEPANSKVDIHPMTPTVGSLLSHLPYGLAVATIWPFPNEINSAAVGIYFAENSVILLLVIAALLLLKKRPEHINIIALCLTYCLLILTLIGLTTPLYGGIERYKSVVIPFILILLLLIYDEEKLKSIFKK